MKITKKKAMGRKPLKVILAEYFQTSNVYSVVNEILAECSTTSEVIYTLSKKTNGKIAPSVNTVRSFLKAANAAGRLKHENLKAIIKTEQRGRKKYKVEQV